MTSIRKPQFPTLKPQSLERDLDQIKDAVSDSTQADGSVDVETLENKVGSRAMEAIKDAFQRTEDQPVASGCGGTVTSSCGGSATHKVKIDPKSLDSGEVQNVMSALLAAKADVRKLDANHDGKISRSESTAAEQGVGLSGSLAEAVVSDASESFKSELQQWSKAISASLNTRDDRQSLDARMSDTAHEHAETSLGAEAITWAYRDLATTPAGVDVWDMDDRLKDAETSWLRNVPLFSRAVTGQGHLSDSEVGKMLGVRDLQGFIDAKKSEISDRVGGDYFTHYLPGKDLTGIEQEGDPDLNRVRSSC